MKKQRKMDLRHRRALIGYSFITPWIVGCAVFFAFPMIYSLLLVFSHIINMRSFQIEFTGVENLRHVLLEDVDFIGFFTDSLKDALINLFLIIAFSLLIAVLINRKIVLRGFFRCVFFLPVILGSGYIMEQLLGENVQQQTISVVRDLLLSQKFSANLPVAVVTAVQDFLERITVILWSSGVQIVLFLGGLQGISPQIYEAARVDAAGEWEQFWLITLPLMAPTLLLNAVYTLVDSFTSSSNETLKYIVKRAFTDGRFEDSAVMGWLYFLAIMVLVGFLFAVFRNSMRNATE